MKSFLTITAILEGLTGLALIFVPARIVLLLLETPLDGAGGIIAAMIGGVAILSLAFACWLSRNSTNNTGIIKPILLYNVGVDVIVVYGFINFQLHGIILWLVLGYHLAMAVWSVMILQKNNT